MENLRTDPSLNSSLPPHRYGLRISSNKSILYGHPRKFPGNKALSPASEWSQEDFRRLCALGSPSVRCNSVPCDLINCASWPRFRLSRMLRYVSAHASSAKLSSNRAITINAMAKPQQMSTDSVLPTRIQSDSAPLPVGSGGDETPPHQPGRSRCFADNAGRALGRSSGSAMWTGTKQPP